MVGSVAVQRVSLGGSRMNVREDGKRNRFSPKNFRSTQRRVKQANREMQ